MSKRELIREIDKLYKIRDLYFELLTDLGRMIAEKKDKSFEEVYDEIIIKYVMKNLKLFEDKNNSCLVIRQIKKGKPSVANEFEEYDVGGEK